MNFLAEISALIAIIIYIDFLNLIAGVLIKALSFRKPQAFNVNFALFRYFKRMAYKASEDCHGVEALGRTHRLIAKYMEVSPKSLMRDIKCFVIDPQSLNL